MIPAHSLSLLLSLLPQGDSREAAPRIEWQRTLADALAVQQATGQPLLIVVNSAGEVFNDRFRTVTYSDSAFVGATRGYVCVVASPDRHNERDHDAEGNRIECPAFPGCTCGEHIAIEPLLFERYFRGDRWAPRHIGVSVDGKILFDRYQDRSMQDAIDAVRNNADSPHAAKVPAEAKALLQRRDAAARRALEGMYRRAAAADRLKLLADAQRATNEPWDLLRLALRGDDAREFERGAEALAGIATVDALPLLEDALARTAEHQERLLDRIDALGKADKGAARLFAHLSGESRVIGAPWRNEWQPPDYDGGDRTAIERELDVCERLVREQPHDADARLRLATAQLAFAELLIRSGGSGVEFWLEDALGSAKRVEGDATDPERQAVIATAAWQRNEPDAARSAAAAALTKARSDRRPNGWLATRLLEVVVRTGTQAAYAKAADPEAVLQPEVARVHEALQLLVASAWAAEDAVLTGVGLLEYVGLRAEARGLLDAAVRRFPSSPAVHERWRARTMGDLGTEAMRKAAGALVAEAADAATAEWFAGYAAIVAAEQHVRDGRRELAVTAYTDSIERFQQSALANPGYADTADHFAVLALGGRALALLEGAKGEDAVADLVRAAALRPNSLDSQDGMKRTPRGIASRVKQALEAAGQQELAGQLRGIALRD